MNSSISIKKIIFRNEFEIELDRDSIVVLVGPNNSGKSLTLKEIFVSISNQNNVNKIVKSLQLQQHGTIEQLFETLQSNRQNSAEETYLIGNAFNQASGVNGVTIRNAWNSLSLPMSVVGIFTRFLETEDRLRMTTPIESYDFTQTLPTNPIQKLSMSTELEKEFSAIFKQAFGQEIIVNFRAGKYIPLHVGKAPEYTKENDRVSSEYNKTLNLLPQLHHQGDGMKSFAGIFLSLFVENYSINIVDEPEAFLHPPQARLLGRMFAKKLDKVKQFFIATHSYDFLNGLLDSSGDRLKIVRIQRDEDKTIINVLDNSEIKRIWKDPILRHSNMLAGLFHSKVIVCEGDSDCKFFSSMMTEITEDLELQDRDYLFIQSGGKPRFPTVIKALKQIEVPMLIVCDFDILNNEYPLRQMYELLGGKWDTIQTPFKIVKNDIDNRRPLPMLEDIRKKLTDTLSKVTDKVIPDTILKELKENVSKESGWTEAKISGASLLKPGDPTVAFDFLKLELESKGIIVIESGEIESLDKTVGGHGPKWVNEVLAKDLLHDPKLEDARIFVKTKILGI